MEVIATTGAYFTSKSGKTWGVTVASTGVQVGQSTSTTIHKGDIPNTQLLDYTRRFVEMCRNKGHRGVVFHLENFEILLDEGVTRCRSFLDDIRDILQLQDTYFILVARSGFFQKVISPLPRVRSIFHSHPIHIPPLFRAGGYSNSKSPL
jgi:phosphoserine aminotransferase